MIAFNILVLIVCVFIFSAQYIQTVFALVLVCLENFNHCCTNFSVYCFVFCISISKSHLCIFSINYLLPTWMIYFFSLSILPIVSLHCILAFALVSISVLHLLFAQYILAALILSSPRGQNLTPALSSSSGPLKVQLRLNYSGI